MSGFLYMLGSFMGGIIVGVLILAFFMGSDDDYEDFTGENL